MAYICRHYVANANCDVHPLSWNGSTSLSLGWHLVAVRDVHQKVGIPIAVEAIVQQDKESKVAQLSELLA